jgi:hypothetical protein
VVQPKIAVFLAAHDDEVFGDLDRIASIEWQQSGTHETSGTERRSGPS